MPEETLGKRIKDLREKRHLSQEELAKAIGKEGKNIRNVISNWEKDRAEPSLGDIKKLAEALDTSVGYLIEGTTGSTHETSINEPPVGYIIKSATEELKDKQRIIDMQAMIVEMQAKQLKEHKALP